MKIYAATWLTDRSLGKSLTRKNWKARLLSFHFLMEQKITPFLLKKYYSTGKCDPRKTKNK